MGELTAKDILPDEAGGFDDLTGPSIDAWFDKASGDYVTKAGTSAVQLFISVDDPAFERPVRMGGFSIGTGGKAGEWKIVRDGREVQIDGKPEANIHGKTNAGIALKELCMIVGEGDKTKGAELLAKRGFRPTQAEFWMGVDSHWMRKEYPNPLSTKDDPKTDITVQIPTDYVKLVEVKVVGSDLSDEDVALLQELAVNCKDMVAMREACVADARVQGKAGLMNQIFNKGALDKLAGEGKLVFKE